MIPEAAVDVGAARLVEMRAAGEHSSFEYAKAVLEAAAPHMLATAWDEGTKARRDYRGDLVADNPYRSQP